MKMDEKRMEMLIKKLGLAHMKWGIVKVKGGLWCYGGEVSICYYKANHSTILI